MITPKNGRQRHDHDRRRLNVVILAVFALLVLIFVILPLAGMAIAWVIWTAVIGIFLGALGRLIVPGPQRIGAMATIACGLVGSLAGGVIGQSAGLHRLATLLVEIGIAAVAVALWSGTHRRPVRGRGHRGIIDV
jgi:uncharacterized membrane protein YeaQ/YmgE (transglycosylase-associated protein family)